MPLHAEPLSVSPLRSARQMAERAGRRALGRDPKRRRSSWRSRTEAGSSSIFPNTKWFWVVLTDRARSAVRPNIRIVEGAQLENFYGPRESTLHLRG